MREIVGIAPVEEKGIKGSLEYCAKGPIRVISPMFKTRSKQIIEKQETERSLGYGANGKMNIGK